MPCLCSQGMVERGWAEVWVYCMGVHSVVAVRCTRVQLRHIMRLKPGSICVSLFMRLG